MTDNRGSQPVPSWFTIAAIGALLWEVLAVAIFLTQAFRDPASLPVDERAVVMATPMWMNAAWSFAVLVGLAGAVLLLMRNRKAEPLLLLSLIAVVVQFSGLLLVPSLRESTPSNAYFLPFVIILVCYGIWHLARRANREGWLR